MICWVAHSTKDFRIILLAVFGLIAIPKQETHADTIRIIYGAISAANTAHFAAFMIFTFIPSFAIGPV